MENKVAVLFARSDSVYKTMPGCDVYDLERDARTYNGSLPVIAYPPCRGWGRLRQFAKPLPGEKELAFFAVDNVRENGGFLEHPEASRLWGEYGLPPAGERDDFGGYTLPVSQYWWGHKAEKRTWLYICGPEPRLLPAMPFVLGEATHVVSSSRGGKRPARPEISKADRERTPPPFAQWLFDLALLLHFPEHSANRIAFAR